MIIVKAYKILLDKQGQPWLNDPKIITKWKLEEIEKFDFDITSPKEWRDFLANYKTSSGKLLPDFSPAGDDIVYHVFSWGMLPPNYEGVFPTRKAVCFFPGYTKDGERRDVKVFGRIRKVQSK